VCSPNPVRTGR